MNTTHLLLAANVAVAGTLIALTALVADRILRGRPAPTRYAALWTALVLILATPALIGGAQAWSLGVFQVDQAELSQMLGEEQVTLTETTPGIDWETPDLAGPSTEPLPAPPAPSAPASALPWGRLAAQSLLGIWLVGAVVGLFRLACGLIAVTRLRRSFEAPSPAALEAARRAAHALGLAREARVALCESVPAPVAIGLFRPTIVLPLAAENLDDAALEAVMFHEVGHLVRGDLWTALAERLAASLFWWSWPVHRLSARMSDLREDLCDNYVLSHQGDGRSLSRLLVELAEQAVDAPRFPAAIGLLDDEPAGLAGRIERLLAKDRNLMTRVTPAGVAMTAALGLAILSGVVLSTVQAAGPESDPAGAPLQVALAPNEPAKELPPPALELKLSVTPERWIKEQPIKLHLEATNKSEKPLQIAWGLVDLGVTFEIYDAAGKVVEKEIGHSLRALPTHEMVAELFPVLQPGESRKLAVDGQWGSRPGVLFLRFLMGHMAWHLDDGKQYTMRAVLNQKELPKEGRHGHQDEKLWWKGTVASSAVALNLAPAPERGGLIIPANTVEKDGLSVSVRTRRPTFVEEKPLEFVVTFKNVSKDDFAFLHTPANYLDWKFHFRNTETGTQWLAVNTAKREGFSEEPAVLKAGESLEVNVQIDSGFLFSHVGPKDGLFKSRRDLMAGKYQMSIAFVGHGATAFRTLVKLPPFWVGELTTKPVSFAVEKKETEKKEQEKGAEQGAPAAPAGKDWMVTLTVRGGLLLGKGSATYAVVVKDGKAKASENRMPDPTSKEAPLQREVVMSDEALAQFVRTLEKLNSWQLADYSKPALDAPDYTLVLTRDGKSRTVRIEGASDSERHLATILAIEQCLPAR